MKTKFKSLLLASTIFLINPVFAQDTASALSLCCGDKDSTVTSSEQISIEPLQLKTEGIENQILNSMTIVVKQRVNQESAVSSSTQCTVTCSAVKHSRKSSHSKQ